jgi:hypothetical protein
MKNKITYLLTLVAFLVSSTLFAQLPPAGWTFNQGCNGFSGACSGPGITQAPAGTYNLTQNGSRTTTTMWNNTVVSLESAFTLNFEINFGNNPETETPPVGGEGIAFGMQSVWGTGGQLTHSTAPAASQLTSGGYGGGDLGMKCLQSGGAAAFPNNTSPANARTISVEWDVFDNTAGAGCTGGCVHGGDLAVDHISVNYDDCSATSSNGTLGAATPALGAGTPINDGVWRAVQIQWVPNAPVSIGSKYDRYVSATDCLQPGTFVDNCGNVVAWSSTTCNANRNCNVMAVSTGTLTVRYNGVVKQSVVLNLEQLLNENQNVNGRNIRKDVIFGFSASTEGKTNYQGIRNITLLPVTFGYFNVIKVVANSAQLNWSTSSEDKNAYFMVQRSTNGTDWTDVKKVKGAGNSNELIQYSYTDENLSAGVYYYRIKQVDIDGKFDYSVTRSVNLNDSELLVEVYPNPINRGENLGINTFGNDVAFEMYDATGKKVFEGINAENVIPTSALEPGIYYLKGVANNALVVTKKIIVL